MVVGEELNTPYFKSCYYVYSVYIVQFMDTLAESVHRRKTWWSIPNWELATEERELELLEERHSAPLASRSASEEIC
jgi:hypothetical protein